MRTTGLLATLMICTFSAAVQAQTIVEDFEDAGSPAFDLNLSYSTPASDEAEIIDFLGPDFDLFISGTTTITFNLDPGLIVNEVSLESSNWASSTAARVIGSSGEAWLTNTTSGNTIGFESFSTSGLDLGAITSIELTTSEGYFDNITLNIVPEPASLAALAVLMPLFLKRP